MSTVETPDDDLQELLAAVNAARATGDGSDPARARESEVESRYGASRRLAVYGTLAPGGPNHQFLAELTGSWRRGRVRGRLRRLGWGVALGFPALTWDPRADEIPVSVLDSDDLPAFWPRLDRFEGPGYLRVLVPVRLVDTEATTVANLYEGRAGEADGV